MAYLILYISINSTKIINKIKEPKYYEIGNRKRGYVKYLALYNFEKELTFI